MDDGKLAGCRTEVQTHSIDNTVRPYCIIYAHSYKLTGLFIGEKCAILGRGKAQVLTACPIYVPLL